MFITTVHRQTFSTSTWSNYW